MRVERGMDPWLGWAAVGTASCWSTGAILLNFFEEQHTENHKKTFQQLVKNGTTSLPLKI